MLKKMWISVVLVTLLCVALDDTRQLPQNEVPEMSVCLGAFVVLSSPKVNGNDVDTCCHSGNCFWLINQYPLRDSPPGRSLKSSNETHYILIIESVNHDYSGNYSFQEDFKNAPHDVAKLHVKSQEECTTVMKSQEEYTTVIRQQEFFSNHESFFVTTVSFHTLILGLILIALWPNLCENCVKIYRWCVQKCKRSENAGERRDAPTKWHAHPDDETDTDIQSSPVESEGLLEENEGTILPKEEPPSPTINELQASDGNALSLAGAGSEIG